MYEEWFLDYASYVILERAIPSIYDGLKPVQRRVMHSLWELEDERYNKVANVVGNTMKYHPHGDISITDAMVQLGQKELLIDTQGNWGNIFTGDNAAAARYIEARLSPFALEVIFNPKTTPWKVSYDGRNKEPVYLPVKFPILLVQGVEGIAVGLSTKILPHNFNELIEASIRHLKGMTFELYPDFQTGGMIDISQYNDGQRGSKVLVRAKITQCDRNTLLIDEIPFDTTTASLMESIYKAATKGKLKIRKVDDNTAEKAEILIRLGPEVSPEKTIDALYAFTDCELSISPLACVIDEEKPFFLGVSDILKKNTDHTVALLKQELEIVLEELQEAWHFSSLERIFIEQRIYRKIEEQKTWETVVQAIVEGLSPHTNHLLRKVTEEDIVKLTEIRIRKISRFDLDKSQQHIKCIEGKMQQVKHHLEHLIEYVIAHFKNLQKKYGKGRERKTEIQIFENIDTVQVAIPNTKLYVDREEGFIGTMLKKEEFAFECSDIDDIIVFRRDGVMLITKVSDKVFVGKDIIYLGVWKKRDQCTIYNLIYRDSKKGGVFMKRFAVTGLIRDHEYLLIQEKKDSEVLYFSANLNGEAEEVTIYLKANPRLKKLRFILDLSQFAIKGKNAKGNLVSKYPVKNIEFRRKGTSTLPSRKIWFDERIQKLNTEGRGQYLGEFSGEDKILSISSLGLAQLTYFDLEQTFHKNLLIIEKWLPEKPISCIYFHGVKNRYFIKRFLMKDRLGIQRFFTLYDKKSFIEYVSTDHRPVVLPISAKEKSRDQILHLEEFVVVKGIQAQGNLLSRKVIQRIDILKPLPLESFIEPQDIPIIQENSSNWSDETRRGLFQEGIQGTLNL